jgi:predicted transcriptional regulator
MVDVNKLKGKIVEKNLSIGELADILGVDKSTLYRKISNHGDTFLIKEADLIAKSLNLDVHEATAIFFSQYVA